MIKPIRQTVVTLLFIFHFSIVFSQTKTSNSFNPGKIWYDNKNVAINAHGGGILYANGKYYWFGEHKIEGEKGNSAYVGIHCYSSKDLYNWNDEGVALKVQDDPLSEITSGCIIERPKVIYNEKTNKYVMWFHLELKGDKNYRSARSGIALADKPNGPYKYLKSMRTNQNQWPINVKPCHKAPVQSRVKEMKFSGGSLPENVDSLNLLGRDFKSGQMARDMTLFLDSDGKAYHIFASEENSTVHISQLTDDYTDYTGKYVRAFIGRFMEGPAIFKKENKYYFIASGCTGWSPNAARSAIADSIFGAWTELGNPCIGTDSALTFNAQSTYILPVIGKKDAFIFLADRWKPENAIDGRYVWLPIGFNKDKIVIRWHDQWTLDYFDKKGTK